MNAAIEVTAICGIKSQFWELKFATADIQAPYGLALMLKPQNSHIVPS